MLLLSTPLPCAPSAVVRASRPRGDRNLRAIKAAWHGWPPTRDGLAANSKLRSRVVKEAVDRAAAELVKAAAFEQPSGAARWLMECRRIEWAELMKRAWLTEVLVCDRCGDPRQVIASITDDEMAEMMLDAIETELAQDTTTGGAALEVLLDATAGLDGELALEIGPELLLEATAHRAELRPGIRSASSSMMITT